MSETTIALIAFSVVLVLIPITLLCLPFIWYGKKHGWGMGQYSWVMIGVGLGWFVVIAAVFLDAPAEQIIRITAMAAVPAIVLGAALIALERVKRRKVS